MIDMFVSGGGDLEEKNKANVQHKELGIYDQQGPLFLLIYLISRNLYF